MQINSLTIGLLVLLAVGYRYIMRPSFMTIFTIGGILIMSMNAGHIALQPFTWVKTGTLVFSTHLFLLYPRSSGRTKNNLAIAIYIVLLLNILEAVVLDGMMGHYVNALIGASLMVSQPGPSRASQGSSRRPSVRYDLSLPWILTYTFWNLAFVCGHYAPRLFDHVAVLAAPLVVSLFMGDRQRWLEARCFTLSVYVIGVVLVIDVFKLPWIAPAENVDMFYSWLVAIGAVLAVANLLMTYRARKRMMDARALPTAMP